MKKFNNLLFILEILFLAGCANQPTAAGQPADNPQVIAIKNFRLALGLPDLPLESKGMEHMINSPSSDLPVAFYVDSDGRKFYVEPQTDTVVEMDARDLLASIPAGAPAISQDQLRKKAQEIARTTTPNFDSMLAKLTYEEGGKVDNYFFEWRKQISPGRMMWPFLQIAFHKSGFIFAYYNTLAFK
jgi:hypothetical protein